MYGHLHTAYGTGVVVLKEGGRVGGREGGREGGTEGGRGERMQAMAN